MHTLSIPSPPADWASFQLGPLTIHLYAIVIVVGMVLCTLWTNRRLVKRGAENWAVLDIALWAIPLGILGARLYHVFTHPGDYFYEGAEWWRVFAIWEGGNAIIGSLIGGALGAYIGCRAIGIKLLSFADALAPGLLLAQAIGRFGNYFNHELFGQPTSLPWGLEIEPTNAAWPVGLPEGTLFHPTFLYEQLWNLVGIGVILLFERGFSMRWGKTLGLYFIWYGLGRMWIESIRVDYSEIVFGMRTNVFGALCLVVIGVILIVVQLKRHPEPERSIFLDGRLRWDESSQGKSDDPDSAVDTAADEAEEVTSAAENTDEDAGEVRADEAPEVRSELESTEESASPFEDQTPLHTESDTESGENAVERLVETSADDAEQTRSSDERSELEHTPDDETDEDAEEPSDRSTPTERA